MFRFFKRKPTINHEQMWNGLKLFTEEMKAFTEMIDAEGNHELEHYKKGLLTAYEHVSKITDDLEELQKQHTH